MYDWLQNPFNLLLIYFKSDIHVFLFETWLKLLCRFPLKETIEKVFRVNTKQYSSHKSHNTFHIIYYRAAEDSGMQLYLF